MKKIHYDSMRTFENRWKVMKIHLRPMKNHEELWEVFRNYSDSVKRYENVDGNLFWINGGNDGNVAEP